ncbi:hypothetical protein SDJN03_24783, partial [Cucurbita argyrosperma subsp. sororia]
MRSRSSSLLFISSFSSEFERRSEKGPSIRLFYPVGCVGAVTDRKPSPRVQRYVGFRIRTLALSRPADVISSVSERSEAVDPILERLKSLEITTPILQSPPTEGSLTDILVRKPPSSSSAGRIFRIELIVCLV